MITIRLKGGMGNQIFQYAFGKNLARLLNTEMQIDLTALLDRSRGDDFVYRDYDLTIFKLENKFAFSPSLLRLAHKTKSSGVTRLIRQYVDRNYKNYKEPGFGFQPTLISEPQDNTVYEGWFQSYRYFEEIEDQLKKDLEFSIPILEKSRLLLSKIKAGNAICLNVRRTDFLKVDTLNTTNKEYFLRAVDRISQLVDQPEFFIFSDDVEWCRQELQLDFPTTVVDHSHKGYKFGNYMQLMKACRHFIIPNSSFAWWAVWLNDNPDKVVIAPKNWFSDEGIDTSALVPKQWIRL